MGGVAKKYITKTWMWKIFLQSHILSTTGDALSDLLGYPRRSQLPNDSITLCSLDEYFITNLCVDEKRDSHEGWLCPVTNQRALVNGNSLHVYGNQHPLTGYLVHRVLDPSVKPYGHTLISKWMRMFTNPNPSKSWLLV